MIGAIQNKPRMRITTVTFAPKWTLLLVSAMVLVAITFCLPVQAEDENPLPLGSRVGIYCGHGSGYIPTNFTSIAIYYEYLGIPIDRYNSSFPSDLVNYRLFYLIANEDAYSSSQVETMQDFLAAGGRLVLVGNASDSWTGQAVFNSLLTSLGSTMSFATDLWDPGCQSTSQILSNPLTAGISSLDFGGSCSINAGSASQLVLNMDGSVTTGAAEAAPNGNPLDFQIVTFGDCDFFASNLCTPGNEALWSNLYYCEPQTLTQTDIELHEQTVITKSQMNFTVCYTNISARILGDDESLTAQLRVLQFANAKSAGDFSSILAPLPILDPGESWCDSFSVSVPTTSKSQKIQKILQAPLRTEVRVLIDGELDPNSESYEAFRIEERDTRNEYWLIGNDEGHDIDPSDGIGGTTSPVVEIGPRDSVFGNEFFSAPNNHLPQVSGDAIAVYGVTPPNAGRDLTISRVDFSMAETDPRSPDGMIGIFPNRITSKGNRPDVLNPLFGPISVAPMPFDSVSGGDHGNTISFSPISIADGEPVWAVYFFPNGGWHIFGHDNHSGGPGGQGMVQFESTFESRDSFSDPRNSRSVSGNWIVAFKVYDADGAFPTGGGLDLKSFKLWQKETAKSIVSED